MDDHEVRDPSVYSFVPLIMAAISYFFATFDYYFAVPATVLLLLAVLGVVRWAGFQTGGHSVRRVAGEALARGVQAEAKVA